MTITQERNISTKYFGDKFDPTKVDGYIYIQIEVNVPPSVMGDQNTTIMFDVKKETMKEVSDNDKMKFGYHDDIDADLTHWSKNISPPSIVYPIELNRQVSADDAKYSNCLKILGKFF